MLMFKSFRTGWLAVTLCVVLVTSADVSAVRPDSTNICFDSVPVLHEAGGLNADTAVAVKARGCCAPALSDYSFRPTQIILPAALVAVGYIPDDWDDDEEYTERLNYRVIDSETIMIDGDRYTRR